MRELEFQQRDYFDLPDLYRSVIEENAELLADGSEHHMECPEPDCNERVVVTMQSDDPLTFRFTPQNCDHAFDYVVSDHPEVTEDMIETAEDVGDVNIAFPPELFQGPFAEYRDAWDGAAPFSDAFLFASYKHMVSAVLGKSVYIESGMRVYPNHYTCLIGTTGDANKSTTISSAIKRILKPADSNVQPLSALATPEGLLNLFVEPKRIETEDGVQYLGGYADHVGSNRKIEQIQAAQAEDESIRICGYFTEMSAVLLRNRKGHSQGLNQALLQLYDCDEYVHSPTKKSPTVAHNPTFSMIGASTFELIEQSLSAEYIFGGLTNRVEWYLAGDRKPDMLLWGHPDNDLIESSMNAVKSLRQKWLQVERSVGFTLESDALAYGTEWLNRLQETIAGDNRELVTETLKRSKLHMLKNSLIFASISNEQTDTTIKREHVELACKLAEYCGDVVRKLFAIYAASDFGRVEHRVLECLQKNPMISAKVLRNRLNSVTFADVDRALKIYIERGIVGVTTPKKTALYYVIKEQD